MRALRTSLFASIAVLAFASAARADDPMSPLQKADRIEAEGRAMIERGQRAEGAKAISEAWRIRADVWNSDQGGAKKDGPRPGKEGRPDFDGRKDRRIEIEGRLGARPEFAILRERIERLRAASREAEEAGHELKKAGRLDDSEEKMEQSGRLWREADKWKASFDSVMSDGRVVVREKEKEFARDKDREKEGAKDRDARPRDRRDGSADDLKAQAARARAEAVAAAADAARADEEGKEEAAKAAQARAQRLKARVRDLEMAIREATAKPTTRPTPPVPPAPPSNSIEAAVKSLQAQVSQLRAMMEEFRKRLGEMDR